MLSTQGGARVWVATAPVDMRKGFDGLAALVEAHKLDLYSGDMFVFVSRRRDRAKVLWWDRGGLVLYHKRLEAGRFAPTCGVADEAHVRLDRVQLAMLLDGVELQHVRRLRAWQPKRRTDEKGIDTDAKA